MAITASHVIENSIGKFAIDYLDGAEPGLLRSSDIADEIAEQQIYHDDTAC